MKKAKSALIILIASIFTIISCDKAQLDNAVVESENNPNKFRQVTFIVSLHHPDYGYVNMEQIDSIQLFVNAGYWGSFTSEWTDTSNKTDTIINHISYSENQIHYLFIAPYQIKTDNLETAGDYLDFLKNRIVLSPGDYVCEMRKINFRNNLGSSITLNTQVYANFTVVENTSSSYVGEIEIPVQF